MRFWTRTADEQTMLRLRVNETQNQHSRNVYGVKTSNSAAPRFFAIQKVQKKRNYTCTHPVCELEITFLNNVDGLNGLAFNVSFCNEFSHFSDRFTFIPLQEITTQLIKIFVSLCLFRLDNFKWRKDKLLKALTLNLQALFCHIIYSTQKISYN